jgi:Viral A-type inclusion protein repeat
VGEMAQLQDEIAELERELEVGTPRELGDGSE